MRHKYFRPLIASLSIITMLGCSTPVTPEQAKAMIEEGKVQEGVKALAELSSQDNAIAQYYLGRYLTNPDHPQDYQKGIQLLEAAGNQGISDAFHLLAYMYHNGKVVPKDVGKAIFFYQRASGASHTLSMLNLGFLYEQQATHANSTEMRRSKYELARQYYLEAFHHGEVAGALSIKMAYDDYRVGDEHLAEVWQSVSEITEYIDAVAAGKNMDEPRLPSDPVVREQVIALVESFGTKAPNHHSIIRNVYQKRHQSNFDLTDIATGY